MSVDLKDLQLYKLLKRYIFIVFMTSTRYLATKIRRGAKPVDNTEIPMYIIKDNMTKPLVRRFGFVCSSRCIVFFTHLVYPFNLGM